ncbi:MAG: permease family-domain-containing protein [Monoraphidium minutum]|nr:MAG: permease family-domain-containing protein [Monoraphidium minutum]
MACLLPVKGRKPPEGAAGGAAADGGAADGGAPPAPLSPRGGKRGRHQGLRFSILDRPPLLEALLLGFQQYLVMLGSTVLIPSVVVPPMGAAPEELAATFLGDRLPIVQGGSFAYISPTLAITAQIKATMLFASEHDRFIYTMRVVSGGIIGSGLIVFGIGFLGIIHPVLRAISPITVAVNIAVLSLALTSAGFPGIMPCPHLGFSVIALVILFSQFLRGAYVPLGRGRKWYVFELCPVILGLLSAWFLAWVLSASGAYSSRPDLAAACSTAQSDALHASPWFRVPYPGQWGAPIVSAYSTLTMLAGALPAMIESLGDYFACAQIAGAPVPPPDVLSRAISWQGLTCVLAGLFGTSSGTTAYNENIDKSLCITRVGSRFVVQLGAGVMILVALVGKFGGLFASIPPPLISGLFCIMFGLIAAVGLSMLAHTDQKSNRNIFIVGFGLYMSLIGFGLYMSLSVAQYFTEYAKAHGGGPIYTGNSVADGVLNSIFATAAAVALILTLFLDNTIPGTDAERGLTRWTHRLAARLPAGPAAAGLAERWRWWEDDHMNAVYGLPFGLTRKWETRAGGPAHAAAAALLAPAAAALAPAGAALRAALTWGGRCGPQHEEGGDGAAAAPAAADAEVDMGGGGSAGGGSTGGGAAALEPPAPPDAPGRGSGGGGGGPPAGGGAAGVDQ